MQAPPILSALPLFRGAYRLWHGSDLVHTDGRRERRALMLGSLAMITMGIAWGVFFVSVGNWPIAGWDLVLILGGLGAAVLIGRNQVQWAAITTFTTLFAVICVIAWFFDTSTPQAPRTTHLYLLPLSVSALLVFRNATTWLRHGVAAICLVTMGFLSVSYGSPLSEYALPQEVRAVGAWVQVIAALTLFYGMLHVMQNDALVRSTLEDELVQALEQGQFQLHYQPQLDLNGRVIGAEALIRWVHPERGMVMPGTFIEVAEQTGLILPIGQWVLQTACAQLASWARQPACRHLRLAVNISQLQFRNKDFLTQILSTIERFGVHAHLLELEITESMLVQDMPDIIQKMTAIRERGVTFSLDDFGTGYSSLSYLKRLPLNQLKIDQSFVRDVLNDPNDASIVETVIALGHNLGLTVMAEGVETQGQHDFLAARGCELFQGYLFSHALPIAEFNACVLQGPESVDPALRHALRPRGGSLGGAMPPPV